MMFTVAFLRTLGVQILGLKKTQKIAMKPGEIKIIWFSRLSKYKF